MAQQFCISITAVIFKLRREMHGLLLLLKFMTQHRPLHPYPSVLPLQSCYSINTRSHDSLVHTIPRHKTDCYSRSFSVRSVLLWNKISMHVKQCTPFTVFEKPALRFMSSASTESAE
ncbi:hypothetical protein PR048_032374 [Dryococelus australis]|uniref:Uncharacterized protein n=1 Tax=Dryococelus australis TaxID=614101 RepID=A0ABQ9G4X1_9NEOP|nr:hypothetical protein PR048_032374 [Dryococelus australis]